MTHVSTIGIDIAKSVFQVHAADEAGAMIFSRRLRRGQFLAFMARQPRCLVGLEAGSGAHHWARHLVGMGFEVRLVPPRDVKPYVKRQKNDAHDAAAICEAVGRASVRQVEIKSEAAQALLSLHRVRDQVIRQRTASLNALRAQLAEFGVVAPQGAGHARRLAERVLAEAIEGVPALALGALAPLARMIGAQDAALAELDREIKAEAGRDERAGLLMSIPGIGPVLATALSATLGDAGAFVTGRHLSAFLGLTPRQNSSGGTTRLGKITKMGDRYLRRLLTLGARAVLAHATRHRTPRDGGAQWAARLAQTKSFALAATALANKMARIVWAVLRRKQPYRPTPPIPAQA